MERPAPGAAFRGTPPASTLPGWCPELLASFTEHVRLGHRCTVAAANTELLAAYWAVGRAILARQHEAGYGTNVIDRLSADLRERFPYARGYSPRDRNQVRLKLGGDEFLCDLLVYHVPLHRYVVIELNAVKFDPALLGQLSMYQAAVDDLLTGPGDATIGWLLCRTKNDVAAE